MCEGVHLCTFTTHKFPTGNSPKFDEFSVEWICLLSIKMYKNSPKTKREMALRTCLFCFLCFLFLLFQRHVSNTCPFQKCKSFSFLFLSSKFVFTLIYCPYSRLYFSTACFFKDGSTLPVVGSVPRARRNNRMCGSGL
jgi:hypothetical protein